MTSSASFKLLHPSSGVTAIDDDLISTWQAQGILMEVLGCGPEAAAELIRSRRNTARPTITGGDQVA